MLDESVLFILTRLIWLNTIYLNRVWVSKQVLTFFSSGKLSRLRLDQTKMTVSDLNLATSVDICEIIEKTQSHSICIKIAHMEIKRSSPAASEYLAGLCILWPTAVPAPGPWRRGPRACRGRSSCTVRCATVRTGRCRVWPTWGRASGRRFESRVIRKIRETIPSLCEQNKRQSNCPYENYQK